jgi:integrase
MPKAFKMTWEPRKTRWRKMYKGKTYTVSCDQLNCHGSKDASWRQANAWWEAKKKRIDNANPMEWLIERGFLTAPAPRPGPSEASSLAQLQRMIERGKEAEKLLASHTPPPTSEPTAAPSPPALPTVPNPDNTVAVLIEVWKGLQKGTIARRSADSRMVDFFGRFAGHLDVTAVTEETWQGFFGAVRDEKDLDDGYRARILQTARAFLQFAFESNLIPSLPRNLKSKLLSFRSSPKAVEPIATETIRQFYQAANEQTRLHALLMLNCGMNAQDISDLQDTEVDWTAGTIRRKRSKTADHANVPTVTYKLWSEAFTLLKQFRSGQPTALLTKSGQPWIIEKEGKERSDSISTLFRATSKASGAKVAPRELRKAGASLLASHATHKFYVEHYLGHSPRSVSERHYVKPDDADFFAALEWLRTELALGKGKEKPKKQAGGKSVNQ